jgi:hypothetical protein
MKKARQLISKLSWRKKKDENYANILSGIN